MRIQHGTYTTTSRRFSGIVSQGLEVLDELKIVNDDHTLIFRPRAIRDVCPTKMLSDIH